MKRLNKKGSTLLELIISIALISVVLVFLMRLLVDLNNTETNNVYAKNNQINRAEIIRMIENDLNNNVIAGLDSNKSAKDNLIINFKFASGKTSTINATSDKFTYTSSSGKKRTWTMDKCSIYTAKADVNYSNDNIPKIYTLQIDIEIHTTNERNKYGNNNLLDDILISYLGKYDNFKGIGQKTCLGYNC